MVYFTVDQSLHTMIQCFQIIKLENKTKILCSWNSSKI